MLNQIAGAETRGPLGPGDDDPRSPAQVEFVSEFHATLGPVADDPLSPDQSETPTGPLGPGDDDPRSPANGTALPATKPLGPGDGQPHDGRIMLAPPPAGPGGTESGPRQLTHLVPKAPTLVGETPVSAVAPSVEQPVRDAEDQESGA